MNKIKTLLKFISKEFNKLPKEIKIIYYVFSSGFLTLFISDLSNVNVQNQYFALFATTVINLAQYSLIQIGDNLRALESIDSTKVDYPIK